MKRRVAETLTVAVVVVGDSFAVQTLTVRFCGQETAKFLTKSRYGNSESPPKTIVSRHNENETFVTLSATLYDTSPSGRLDRGYYEFPFAFVLPANLPGSASSAGKVSFSVQYAVEAQCLAASSSVLWSQSVAVHLQEPPPPPATSPLRAPLTSTPVSSQIPWCCGCFAGGKLSIAVRLPDSHLAVGQEFAIDIAYRNFSYAAVRRVAVLIKEYVYAGHAPEDASTTTVIARIPVAANRLPPPSKSRWISQTPEEYFHYTEMLPQHQEYSAVSLVQDALTSEPALHIPVAMVCPPTRSSLVGRLGRVSHTLEVVVDIGVFAPQLVVELPLTIYDTRPRVVNAAAALKVHSGPNIAVPEGWVPVVAQTVTIDAAAAACPSPGAAAVLAKASVSPTAPPL
eukprot:gene8860-6376_t